MPVRKRKRVSARGGAAHPHLATSEAGRVVRSRMPSLIGLTSLLSVIRGYARPVGSGATGGPALIP